MRKLMFITLFLFFSTSLTFAQEIEPVQQDTVVIVRPPLLDSTMLNKDVFSMIKEKGPQMNFVKIEQSSNVESALYKHISTANGRKIVGYRVRIFFDNKQDSRNRSENIASQFSSQFPQIRVYSTYENPFFKVTVGDFRTKSEAMMLIKKIEGDYRSVFLVKETINYPPI